MRVAVLGTGMVGRALASRFAELGHEVMIGTRDVATTLGRTEPDFMGNPPLATWLAVHPDLRLGTFAEAAGSAELVVNATAGDASVQALEAAGAENLAGKVLLDVSNPLDYSHGMPPTLFVKDTDSLAEQIQRAFPDTKVVKALNTMNAYVQANPKQLAGGDHTVFVSGDDVESKRVVAEVLASFGHTDIIDLGDLSTARGAEMVLPLWTRLWTTLGTPMFNFKVVR
jgi:8-hydroxy-5-deazaflavin:NADPH oxidoreductase